MIYTFLNKRTKKIEEHTMSMADYDGFKANNTHLERYIDSPPMFSYSSQGDMTSKTDNTWKEVLSKISDQNPRSQLAKDYGKRTIKQIKTDNVIEKHLKKQKQKP